MTSYYHEIPCPSDPAMFKFLWFSFFHDGRIEAIEAQQPGRGDVTLRIESVWNDEENGLYALRFHRVRHFEHCCLPWQKADCVYSTIFLDTPLLHLWQRESGKPLYHLRFTTDTGYIDLIFERFSIRRVQGRVSYRCTMDPIHGDSWHAPVLFLRHWYADRVSLAKADLTDADADDLDEYRFLRMRLTQREGDLPSLLAQARNCLAGHASADGPWQSAAYAAHELGHHGTVADLPALGRLHALVPPCEHAVRRTVQDAIDRIHERTAASP